MTSSQRPTESQLWKAFWEAGLDPSVRSEGPGRSTTSRRFVAELTVDGRHFLRNATRRPVALRRLLNDVVASELADLEKWVGRPALTHGRPWRTETAAGVSISTGPLETAVLLELSKGSRTDLELADRLGWAPAQFDGRARKRRSDLLDAGLVEPVRLADGTVLERANPSGRKATVWEISTDGLSYLAAMLETEEA